MKARIKETGEIVDVEYDDDDPQECEIIIKKKKNGQRTD